MTFHSKYHWSVFATFTICIIYTEARVEHFLISFLFYKLPSLGTNDEYEIGDLSGKYGSMLNLTSYNEKHIDYNLPLFGKNSIQGRSMVIHKMKTMGSMRWVCADVHQVANEDMFLMKTKITFNGPTLKGYILLVSPSNTYIHILLNTSPHEAFQWVIYGCCWSFMQGSLNWHVPSSFLIPSILPPLFGAM